MLTKDIEGDKFEIDLKKYGLNNLKIVKLATSLANIFLLTSDGRIHFTKRISKFYPVDIEEYFLDILSDDNQMLCLTEKGVLVFQYTSITITKYINFFEYFLHQYQATFETIKITTDGYLEIFRLTQSDDKNVIRSSKLFLENGKLENNFKIVGDKPIGIGGFGQVYLVDRKYSPGHTYALKVICIEKYGKKIYFN